MSLVRRRGTRSVCMSLKSEESLLISRNLANVAAAQGCLVAWLKEEVGPASPPTGMAFSKRGPRRTSVIGRPRSCSRLVARSVDTVIWLLILGSFRLDEEIGRREYSGSPHQTPRLRQRHQARRDQQEEVQRALLSRVSPASSRCRADCRCT